MTLERLNELKTIITQRANYYSNIGFSALAIEFTSIGNFLSEIENVIKENMELKTRIQILEENSNEKILEARAAREGEED